MLKSLFDALERISRPAVRMIGVLLVLVIGTLDHITGYEVTLSIFYVLPILFVAWFADRGFAILVSFLSAGSWLMADITSGHQFSSPAIAAWNMLVVLGFFLLVAFSMFTIKSSLERERLLARTDFLTGALNSRAFTDAAQLELDRASRYGRPFTLAYLDVDNFKQANDSLGHSAGDRLLAGIAGAMREHVRSTDLVARIGGDEFALLMPETDEEHSRTAIGKVHMLLHDLVRRNAWPVSFSIGAATCAHPCTLDELIHEADRLLYAAKSSGKDQAVFGTVHKQSGTTGSASCGTSG